MKRRQLLQSAATIMGLGATRGVSKSLGTAEPDQTQRSGTIHSLNPSCYTDDWKRTQPDLVVYLPAEPPFAHESSDHVLVDVTPAGDLLAIWTFATKENVSDNSVVYARSTDNGQTWTAPKPIATPSKLGTFCNFGWPVKSKTGRIYVSSTISRPASARVSLMPSCAASIPMMTGITGSMQVSTSPIVAVSSTILIQQC